MTDPTFSIVVPCFNYARYLPTTLDSVLAQGRDDVEVIVVDDASTDGSAEIARGYGDPVRVLALERNRGPGGAWAAGLEVASGRYVCKLDADDWQLPGLLDRIEVAFVRSPGSGLVATGVRVLDDVTGRAVVERPTQRDVVLDPAQLRKRLLRKFCFRMPSSALRRSALVGQPPPRDDLRLPHDWEYFLRVLRGWGASLIAEPLAVYRVHDASLTLTSRSADRLRDDLTFLLDLARDPDDPAYLTEPERRLFALGVAESYLGTVGRTMSVRDVGAMLRSLRTAASLVASEDRLGVVPLARYVVWGAAKRVRESRADQAIELEPR